MREQLVFWPCDHLPAPARPAIHFRPHAYAYAYAPDPRHCAVPISPSLRPRLPT